MKTHDKKKPSKFRLVNKSVEKLEVGEVRYPYKLGRYKGVSVGRRKDGYFVATHRASSKSYSSPSAIPNSVIAKIEETG
ncbi:hypothetical protein LCGC14_2108610 [marine sediment metagenome]|uniref:Uncharacterized protein n=1 Tax=marine sediment metagenome TaxID=412755 RepID=A0A0F9H421_9ZZZZ